MVYGRVNTDIRYPATRPEPDSSASPALFLFRFCSLRLPFRPLISLTLKLQAPDHTGRIDRFFKSFFNSFCAQFSTYDAYYVLWRYLSRRVLLKYVYDEYFSIYFPSCFLSAPVEKFMTSTLLKTVRTIARERESIDVFVTELITRVFHCKSILGDAVEFYNSGRERCKSSRVFSLAFRVVSANLNKEKLLGLSVKFQVS